MIAQIQSFAPDWLKMPTTCAKLCTTIIRRCFEVKLWHRYSGLQFQQGLKQRQKFTQFSVLHSRCVYSAFRACACPLSLAWAVAFCPPFDPSSKLVNNGVSSKLFLTLWTWGGEISTGLNNSRSISLSLAPRSCWSFLDPPPEAFLVARVGVPGELSVGLLLEVFALLQVRLLFRDKTGNLCRDEIKFNAFTTISYTWTAKIEMHDVWERIQLHMY